jgi:hypothetical protein
MLYDVLWRKDCMFYDVFSSKDLIPVKSLHALHDLSRLDTIKNALLQAIFAFDLSAVVLTDA